MNTDAGQVTQDDITIDSNHETVDQIELAFSDVDSTDASDDLASASKAGGETVDDSAPTIDDPSEQAPKAKSNRRACLGYPPLIGSRPMKIIRWRWHHLLPTLDIKSVKRNGHRSIRLADRTMRNQRNSHNGTND